MKYVVIATAEGERGFVFPHDVNHDAMFEAIQSIKVGDRSNWKRPYRQAELVSAGFVSADGVCHGYSESLGVKSRPELDTALLKRQHV